MSNFEHNKFSFGDNDSALLRAALDSMSYAFSVWSEDYRLTSFNERLFEEYFGRNEALKPGLGLMEVCELSILNGNHPESTVLDIHDRMISRFETITEIRIRQEFVAIIGGRQISTTYVRLPDVGWVITQKNITESLAREKHAAQRSLEFEHQNSRFNAAVNNMPHGLALYDADLRLTVSNEPFAKLYDFPESLVVRGARFWDQYAHRERQGTVCASQDRRQNIEIMLAERLSSQPDIVFRDGRVMRIKNKPMRDGGWLTVHEEITAQKRQEDLIAQRNRELEQQNIRFNAAINNMSHGLTMYNAALDLVVCNDVFAKLYKFPAKLVQPGVSFWSHYDHRHQHGMVATAPMKRAELAEMFKARRGFRAPVKFIDGRVMLISHQPLKDGGWLGTYEDITEQHRTQETINHLARFDVLTGLANRSTYSAAMADGELRMAAGETMAVVCLDLDYFKPINDNLGHAAGDIVLKLAAQRILNVVGDSGVAARLGGDEFAVLIGNIEDAAHAERIAKDLIEQISEPMEFDGLKVQIGATAGIVLAPMGGKNTETLMRNGDLALYHAKNNNRGGYCFFESQMETQRKRRGEIELGLKNALADDELRLHYQPLLSLKENRVMCCEALMRWKSPVHGFVGPDEFIAVAEETGLIRELGSWALQHACKTAVTWPAHVRIAVNVSPVQFMGDDLVERVISALEVSGLAPERLELEITESVFLADNTHNFDILHRLRDLGVRIALDDFGTGYSSLSYLRSFPFDKIKIDRTFISDLEEKPENEAIVRAVVQLGASLGMTTTAEGVETEAQLNVIRAQGCTEVQGYLFSRPLPASDVSKLLGSNSYDHVDDKRAKSRRKMAS